MEQKTAEEIAEILTGWRDRMRRHRDPLRCAYDDDLCPGQHPVVDSIIIKNPDGTETCDEERVTCPQCREYLGLPTVEEADA